MAASHHEATHMDNGFEFEGCLHACTGLAEALDAAGIGCHAHVPGEEGRGDEDAGFAPPAA